MQRQHTHIFSELNKCRSSDSFITLVPSDVILRYYFRIGSLLISLYVGSVILAFAKREEKKKPRKENEKEEPYVIKFNRSSF